MFKLWLEIAGAPCIVAAGGPLFLLSHSLPRPCGETVTFFFSSEIALKTLNADSVLMLYSAIRFNPPD